MTKMFVREEFSANAGVDELIDVITAQGDGATGPYPTDPSVPRGGDASIEGAILLAALPHHERGAFDLIYDSPPCGQRSRQDLTDGTPRFAPRLDLEERKPIGVRLSDVITALNCASIHESTFAQLPDGARALDRLDIDEPLILMHESDVIEIRRVLLETKTQAEHEAELLKTARKNVTIALAEARRIDAVAYRREVANG